MRTCDKLEDIQAQVECKHGCLKNFRLFTDTGKKPPKPGEEIKDFSQTLDDIGFTGAILDPERPVAHPKNATVSAVLHCEFEPAVKGTLLEVDSLVMVENKLCSSLDANTREKTQADRRVKKEIEQK